MDAGPALDRLIEERIMGNAHGDDVPSYSTDRGLAVEIFETMVENVGYGQIDADMEDARGKGLPYVVRFDSLDGACEVSAIGPFAEAICNAALLAMGVKL